MRKPTEIAGGIKAELQAAEDKLKQAASSVQEAMNAQVCPSFQSGQENSGRHTHPESYPHSWRQYVLILRSSALVLSHRPTCAAQSVASNDSRGSHPLARSQTSITCPSSGWKTSRSTLSWTLPVARSRISRSASRTRAGGSQKVILLHHLRVELIPFASTHRDKSRERGRLRAKVEPPLTLGDSGFSLKKRAQILGVGAICRHNNVSSEPRDTFEFFALQVFHHFFKLPAFLHLTDTVPFAAWFVVTGDATPDGIHKHHFV